MESTTLLAKSEIKHRIDFVTELLNSCAVKINHMDDVRQNHFIATIAFFAAIFGFTVQAHNLLIAIISSVILTLFMYIFLLIEKKRYKYHKAWQATSKKLKKVLEDLINEPEKDYTFFTYDAEWEKNTKFQGYKATIYKLFLLGGPISLLVYLFK